MASRTRFCWTSTALGLAVLLFPTTAPAATIPVDDGAVVVADEGLCSLREAIRNANADAQVDNTNCPAGSGFDVIELPTEGEFEFFDADAGDPANALPVITTSLRIEGNGSDILRDGACVIDGTAAAGEFRLLEIQGAETFVALQHLYLGGGCADGNGPRNDGGAIRLVDGVLELSRVVVEDSHARDKSGGLDITGGVIEIADSAFRGNSAGGGAGAIGNGEGDLTIVRSTISGNSSGGEGGGGIGTSGDSKSTRTILRNSTVSSNSSTGAGGGGLGNTGELRIEFSTITGNSVTGVLGGGGIGNAPGGVVLVKSSIVAENGDGGDCSNFGLFGADGVNFDSDGTCAAGAANFTTVTPTDLALEPLTDNGGRTETHDLGFGSVAIDAADDCTAIAGLPVEVDQRSFDRPQDGDGDGVEHCDVGAVEASEVIRVDGTCTLGDAIASANHDSTVGGCANEAFGDDTIVLDVDTTLTAADTVRSTFVQGAFAGLPDVTTGISIRAGQASVIERDESLACDVPDGPDEFRLLQVVSTAQGGGRLELVGVTLRGGCADKGGAVLGFNRLDVVDSTFRDNSALSAAEARGGAVFADDGIVTIAGSLFQGNLAEGDDAYGGALAAFDVRSLTTSRFIENSAETDGSEALGGAAWIGSEIQVLRNVLVEANLVRDAGFVAGGGLWIDVVETMSQVLLSNNTARGRRVLAGAGDGGWATGGGAFIQTVGSADGVTLVGNEAIGGDADSGSGGQAASGGLHLDSEGTLRHLTVSGNVARGGNSTSGQGGSASAGGLQADGEFQLENSTVAANEAVAGLGGGGDGTATGGGLLASESMTLGSSLLEQNTTDVAGTVVDSDCADLGTNLTSLGYNAVVEPTTCTFTATGDQTGVSPSLLPLGEHGCVMPLPDGTCLPSHPVALDSDAIDTGSCTASGVTEDIRDFFRPVDFAGVPDADDGCDVGAYESRDLDEGTGDGVEDGFDNCPADVNPSQDDTDGDGFGDACDLCTGDDATGDADGDGLCADVDCNDDDPTNDCGFFFDGFESGDTSAWSVTAP